MFSSALRRLGRMAPGRMRALAAGSAAVAALGGLSLGASVAVMEESFRGGQAIGEGLKAEIWKAKHPQSNVLDMEDEAVQLLLTHVRDVDCTGPCFTSFANILVRHLLTNAMAALPNDEEAEITTPSGHKFQGLKLEDDVKLLAVYVHPDGSDASFLARAIADCFRDADVTGVTVRNGRIVKDEISRDAGEEYSNVLIVSPSMGTADAEIALVNALAKKGFKEEDMVLATIVASLDGINKFTKDCKDVQVVAATVDPRVSSKGEVIPGIGDIFARYSAALTEPEKRPEADDGDGDDNDNGGSKPAESAAAAAAPAAEKKQAASGGWGGWWSQGK